MATEAELCRETLKYVLKHQITAYRFQDGSYQLGTGTRMRPPVVPDELAVFLDSIILELNLDAEHAG